MPALEPRTEKQSVNPETGFVSVRTRLQFAPKYDLRVGLTRFLNPQALYGKQSITLFSQQERFLDLGNGNDIPGEDTAADAEYRRLVAEANEYTFQLDSQPTMEALGKAGITLSFGINFAFKEGFEQAKIVSPPLFDPKYTKKNVVMIQAAIPSEHLVEDDRIDDAFALLEKKMGDSWSSGNENMAPFGMAVSGARVIHSWTDANGPVPINLNRQR